MNLALLAAAGIALAYGPDRRLARHLLVEVR